jgi:putative FmdB family regulatory protein
MPIYAYRCSSCGHAQDVLQKMSDAVLTTCPACGAEAYVKQLTAAGFQLKGSGWYVTDFRGDKTAGKADAKPEGDAAPAGGKPADPAAKPADKPATDSKPAEKAAAPAPAPATPAPTPSSGS